MKITVEKKVECLMDLERAIEAVRALGAHNGTQVHTDYCKEGSIAIFEWGNLNAND